jgi:hypothetical protein
LIAGDRGVNNKTGGGTGDSARFRTPVGPSLNAPGQPSSRGSTRVPDWTLGRLPARRPVPAFVEDQGIRCLGCQSKIGFALLDFGLT